MTITKYAAYYVLASGVFAAIGLLILVAAMVSGHYSLEGHRRETIEAILAPGLYVLVGFRILHERRQALATVSKLEEELRQPRDPNPEGE
jgi:hypothetical protein